MGAVLKYEVVICDTANTAYPETGKTFTASTVRVRPSPSPPKRALIPVVPSRVLAAGGSRFTILTYNLLADLYATVRWGLHPAPWHMPCRCV